MTGSLAPASLYALRMFGISVALLAACSAEKGENPTAATASAAAAHAVAPIPSAAGGTPPVAARALSEPSSSAPSPAPALAVTQASWAPDALEELLAPIALYPDQLLGQILAASVNSQEVLDAGNWLLQNQSLKGDALDAAAAQAGFGPAMRALVQFPSIVDMLCQQIDWTKQLGSAFTSDQRAVLDAVQTLRKQAAQAGNLKSTPEQKVETTTDGGKTIVEVKPANPQVVYVPHYDPAAVYAPLAQAAPAPAAPTSAGSGTGSRDAAIAGGLLAFGVGVALGGALEDDDDYCYPHWGAGVVYYGPRPFYPPAYVYRPVYGPALRPAYRYVSPPGYRYAYNNVNVNVNRSLVVDNDNYFNRFSNNQNLREAAPRNERVDRGYGTAAHERIRTSSAAERPESRPVQRQSALEGAGRPERASFDRAASARGHASIGARDARDGRHRR